MDYVILFGVMVFALFLASVWLKNTLREREIQEKIANTPGALTQDQKDALTKITEMMTDGTITLKEFQDFTDEVIG